MKRRYYTATGRYRSDDIEADFTASICDDSAPDEMPGRDVSGIELVALTICGVDWMPDWTKLSAKAQGAIMELADDVEWGEA